MFDQVALSVDPSASSVNCTWEPASVHVPPVLSTNRSTFPAIVCRGRHHRAVFSTGEENQRPAHALIGVCGVRKDRDRERMVVDRRDVVRPAGFL